MFKEEVLKNELENALMKMKEDYPSLFLSLKIKKDEQMNGVFCVKKRSGLDHRLLIASHGDDLTWYLVNHLVASGLSLSNSCFYAWMTVLHHEMKHVDLNLKCIESGLDARNGISHLMVEGLVERGEVYKSVAIDSIIESLCDINMMNYIKTTHALKEVGLDEALITFRKTSSVSCPPEKDGYRTSCVLERIHAEKERDVRELLQDELKKHQKIISEIEKENNKKRFGKLSDWLNGKDREKKETRSLMVEPVLSGNDGKLASWRQNNEKRISCEEKKPSGPGMKT